MRLFLHQLRTEQLMFWRNREAAIFVFVFPPLLYLLLGAVYDGEIRGFPAASVFLAGLIGYGCANTAFAGLAITLVIRREGGVLKRLRATPLPASTYLAAVLASTLLVFALQIAVTILLGVLLYDASGARSWLAVVLAGLLGGICFAGMGFGATTLIRSSEGASAVVNLIVLPMAFLSGSFGPTQDFPDVLQWVGKALPLKYLVDLLEDGYLEGEAVWSNPAALAVLVAWGAGGLALAARRFRWMPRER
ncbi:MAG: ABC transporter permease [Actinobacteria bacterium]|nr:ABC transporter permease [Actinomycetota bacterium]